MARHRPLKVVVDTNVVAYYLLGTDPFVDEVQAFWHRPLDLAARALWEAESQTFCGWRLARASSISERPFDDSAWRHDWGFVPFRSAGCEVERLPGR